MLLALALRMQLEARGFKVVGVVHNGEMAVKANRELCPDAILMDIRMPVLDGIEATRQIMAERPTCIVVLSALAEQDAIARATAAGSKTYLTKPASIDEIIEALEKELQECP
jgi:two-component system, response regulator PdtaR